MSRHSKRNCKTGGQEIGACSTEACSAKPLASAWSSRHHIQVVFWTVLKGLERVHELPRCVQAAACCLGSVAFLQHSCFFLLIRLVLPCARNNTCAQPRFTGPLTVCSPVESMHVRLCVAENTVWLCFLCCKSKMHFCTLRLTLHPLLSVKCMHDWHWCSALLIGQVLTGA